MAQDLVSDALNQIMNTKRVGKTTLKVKRSSKLLLNLFEIMKKMGYIDFKVEENEISIEIKKINECRSIKPRFYVSVDQIDKYMRRFLPSRKFGFLIISTSQGLLTDEEAYTKHVGGSLIAYFY